MRARAGFLEGEPFQLDRPLWSLFYEMLANIVYASILFRLSLKALTRVLVAAMLASLILFERFGSLLVGSKHGELWWGLLGVLPPFIFGMVLNRIRDDRRVPPLPFWAAGVLLLASFVPYNLGDANAAYELVVCLIAYPAIILCAQRAEPGRGWARIATRSPASHPIRSTPCITRCSI